MDNVQKHNNCINTPSSQHFQIINTSFIPVFRKTVEEESCSTEQVFNVDENGPSSTARSLRIWPSMNTIYTTNC
jgi:hypothetical protein